MGTMPFRFRGRFLFLAVGDVESVPYCMAWTASLASGPADRREEFSLLVASVGSLSD